LDKLTKNLRKDQFKNLSKYIPKEHLYLITRKLAYSYEYMDSPEKFKKTCLPPIEKFYSSLNKKMSTRKNTKMRKKPGKNLTLKIS